MTMKPAPLPTQLTKPYFDAAAQGQLCVQYCNSCDRHFLYPRQWCPFCWSMDLRWRPTSGRGVVIACTAVHQAPYPAYATDVPYLLAIIRLDEGAQLMANVIKCPTDQCWVGMSVRATFEWRRAVMIPQFAPLNADGD